MSDETTPPRKPRFFPIGESDQPVPRPAETRPPARPATDATPPAPPHRAEPPSPGETPPPRRAAPTTVDIAARFAPRPADGPAPPPPGFTPLGEAQPAPRPLPKPAPQPQAQAQPQPQPQRPEARDELPRDAGLHKPRDRMSKTEEPAAAAEDAALEAEPGGSDERTLPTLKDIKRGFRWSAILMSALGGLAAMAFVNWLYSFVAELLVRRDWIGWLALGLTAIALTALAVIILRELYALVRLRRLGYLREHAARALTHDDRAASEKVQAEIAGLLADRRSLAWGLAALKEQKGAVLAARDRLVLVERNLIAPLDRDAHRIVADSAKRVSVMTAISPFVFLDMMLVALENLRMLRRLMALYGGRPGILSQFKLVQLMVASLAMSGGIAVGADLLSHIMGRQVATRLAGRLGEGFVNGSLTARLGITATKLIRPLPYIEAKPASIATFVKELTRGSREVKEG